MHREPDVGLDPGSPGSRPGPKAGAKPLRHPGDPTHRLSTDSRVSGEPGYTCYNGAPAMCQQGSHTHLPFRYLPEVSQLPRSAGDGVRSCQVRSLRRSDLPKVRQVEGRALTAPQSRSGRPMQRERGEVRKTSCSSFHLLEALDQGQVLGT
ncbi:hypothetical protein VULLAG_LOCUS2793 [Vulpes lagopus]